MQSAAQTPEAYIAEIPEARKEVFTRLRGAIKMGIYAMPALEMVYGSKCKTGTC